jgi:hypothetical protein
MHTARRCLIASETQNPRCRFRLHDGGPFDERVQGAFQEPSAAGNEVQVHGCPTQSVRLVEHVGHGTSASLSGYTR